MLSLAPEFVAGIRQVLQCQGLASVLQEQWMDAGADKLESGSTHPVFPREPAGYGPDVTVQHISMPSRDNLESMRMLLCKPT